MVTLSPAHLTRHVSILSIRATLITTATLWYRYHLSASGHCRVVYVTSLKRCIFLSGFGVECSQLTVATFPTVARGKYTVNTVFHCYPALRLSLSATRLIPHNGGLVFLLATIFITVSSRLFHFPLVSIV